MARLQTLDLNLLRVFDTLMRARHVSRAADRLGLTQSATSNALERLRQALGDRLLERQGNRMVPTRAALDLWPHVQDALAALEAGLSGFDDFSPGTHAGRFAIGIDEYSLHLWGADALRAVSQQAPAVSIAFLPASFQTHEEALLNGDLDLIIGPVWQATPGLERQLLCHEEFTGLVARDHPLAKADRPGLDDYLAHSHVLVSPRGIVPGNVDAGLAAIGRVRRVSCAVPFYANAPEFLLGSDAILNLGRRLAARMAGLYPLATFDLPLAVPGFDIAMLWTRRNTASPAHAWLRGAVGSCATRDAAPKAGPQW